VNAKKKENMIGTNESMRILMVHNYYQNWGGEDTSVGLDIELLRNFGHTVQLYSRHNNEISSFSMKKKISLLYSTTWSRQSYQEITKQIDTFKPDIVHFQNFFPLVSPSAYYACHKRGIPVIQTLHNYRLLCPMSMLIRNGTICESCITNSLFSSILFRCYRSSRIQTSAVALMLSVHRALGSWKNQVDLFTTPSAFAKQKFIDAGLPEEKIVIRPHYLLNSPGPGSYSREGALFVGRLSSEKGLDILLKAWSYLPHIPLRIIGDGPLRPQLERIIKQNKLDHIDLVGFVPVEQILQEYQKALFLVAPSIVYETFGRTILEAYATETPVIASRIGAFQDIVEDQETGMLIEPGDAEALRDAASRAYQNPQLLNTWGKNGYKTLVERYSPQPAHKLLLDIYQKVIHSGDN
jgi:glycosyltransferase involved in cell wall biosynthesis